MSGNAAHGSLLPSARPDSNDHATAAAPQPGATDDDEDLGYLHPAYNALFEAATWTGGVIAQAYAMVEEVWDSETQGPLPVLLTVQRWAARDGWMERIGQEILQHGDRQTALVNLGLQTLQRLAIKAAREVLLEIGDPKFAAAKRGLFRDIMWLTGAGIIGARYGHIDASVSAALTADADDDDGPLDIKDIIARRTAASREGRERP
jgi:hypothetical protein